MPKFSVQIPHTLSQEEAAERLDRFTEFAGGNSQVTDLTQTWEGNCLKFAFKSYGIKIQGAAEVSAGQVDVVGDLPFSAMMFKGKIESEVKKVLGRLLGAPRGQPD